MVDEHYIIFTQDDCQWCHKAIDLCKEYNLDYEEYNVTNDPVKKAYLKSENFKTVPQIFLGPMYIGGYEQFAKFLYHDQKNWDREVESTQG